LGDNLFRICGFILPRMRSSMTLVMKVLLHGMKLIFRMPFGDLRVPGLLLWSIPQLRYDSLKFLLLPILFVEGWREFKVVTLRLHFMVTYSFCRLWSTTGVYMLMFSLHNLDIRLILVIRSTSLRQHLEGRIVCLFLTH
jgi:hypothetical protein